MSYAKACKVEHHIDFCYESVHEGSVCNVTGVMNTVSLCQPRRQIAERAIAQIVENFNFVVIGDQTIYQMRTDEACPTRHQAAQSSYLHG